MAIRTPSDAQHRPLPRGAEGERIATAFGLAMTYKLLPCGSKNRRPGGRRSRSGVAGILLDQVGEEGIFPGGVGVEELQPGAVLAPGGEHIKGAVEDAV